MLTQVTRVQRTKSSGQYVVVDIESGTYKISVEKVGFGKTVTVPLQLDIAESHLVNLSLKLGTVTQSIEVTAGVTVDL
jgi:hypothetical protein